MGITIDKVDDGFPISVIVPLSEKRRNFFENYTLPLIEANNPKEIIINDNNGLAPKKRNDGFDRSTQPYVFFLDDDCLLPANHLEKLYNILSHYIDKGNNKIVYAYSGYHGIVLHPHTHPMKGNFKIETKNFNSNLLMKGNYISTMSLIKREYFPRFDENLKRLQDWDIWLSILKNGYEGIAVHNNEFFAYYLDEGITANTNNERDAILAVIKKHKIGI